MDLYEIIDQVKVLLQQRGRLAYQALKYQFKLDDDGIAALKSELIGVQELAVDKDGKMLVWVGASSVPSSQFPVPSFKSRRRTPNSEP